MLSSGLYFCAFSHYFRPKVVVLFVPVHPRPTYRPRTLANKTHTHYEYVTQSCTISAVLYCCVVEKYVTGRSSTFWGEPIGYHNNMMTKLHVCGRGIQCISYYTSSRWALLRQHIIASCIRRGNTGPRPKPACHFQIWLLTLTLTLPSIGNKRHLFMKFQL